MPGGSSKQSTNLEVTMPVPPRALTQSVPSAIDVKVATHKAASLAVQPPAHRWKVLSVGVAANVGFSAAAAGLPTTAIALRADYALNATQLGLALGLLGLGVALFELPWGLLTDKWGDRPVLLTGLSATAIVLAALAAFATPADGVIPSFWCLATGLVLIGIMGGSVNGASGRAVMAWFQEGERGLAMSIRQTAVPLGGGLGALLLPWLASIAGFVAVFLALAALCALPAWMAWAWLYDPAPALGQAAAKAPEPSSGPTVPTAHPSGPATRTVGISASPLRNVQVWRNVAGIAILCCPQFAVLSFASVFLHDVYDASLGTITTTLVAVQGGAMIARVWSGRWTDKHHNRHAYLRACAQLSALAFTLLAALTWGLALHMPAGATAIIAIALALTGIGVSAWHGVAYTQLATLAGAQRAGTALGLANTGVYLGLFVTPLVITQVISVASWPAVWLLAAACAVLAQPLLASQAQTQRS